MVSAASLPSLNKIAEAFWGFISTPAPSPAACGPNGIATPEAPNLSSDNLQLSVADLNAILSMGKGAQILNECHVSTVPSLDDFGTDHAQNFWNAAARYIIDVKYANPVKQGYNTEDDGKIRTALSALPLDAQREAVITSLAAKLKEKNPSFLQNNDLKFDSEKMRVWCNAPRTASVPVPKSININLAKSEVLKIVNGINNQCVDKDKPAPETFKTLVSYYWNTCQSQKDAVQKYLAEKKICAASEGKTEPKYEIASVEPASGSKGRQVIVTIKPKPDAAPATQQGQPAAASQPAKSYFMTSEDFKKLTPTDISFVIPGQKTADDKVKVAKQDSKKNPNPIVLTPEGNLVVAVSIDRQADLGMRTVVVKVGNKEYKLENGFEVKKGGGGEDKVDWGKDGI